jgi:hypothetical protein
MTTGDLLVLVPWLIFGAGIAMIGYRLLSPAPHPLSSPSQPMTGRQVSRVRYEPADRAWFAVLARIVSRRRWSEVFPVTPATLRDRCQPYLDALDTKVTSFRLRSSIDLAARSAQRAPVLPRSTSGCLDQAAVDHVIGARDVGCPVGGQERDQRGDFFWRGETARGEADSGGDRLAGGLRVHAGGLGDGVGDSVLAEPQVSGDRPGGDRVDTDAARAELLGESLAQVTRAALAAP